MAGPPHPEQPSKQPQKHPQLAGRVQYSRSSLRARHNAPEVTRERTRAYGGTAQAQ